MINQPASNRRVASSGSDLEGVQRQRELISLQRDRRQRLLETQPLITGAPWLAELHRLKHLEQDFAFLPTGWNGGKGPMFYGKKHPQTPEDWTQEALSVDQLLRWGRTPYLGVGARTGLHAGPLMAFDFDGASSVDFGCEIGIEPWAFDTWHVHRDNDPWRLKVLCQPTPEQLATLPVGVDGSIEFQGKTQTRPKEGDDKGEALEVFFSGKRQVVLIGQHPSGGNYYWPAKQGQLLGPEQLAPPPKAWFDYAIQIATDCHDRVAKAPARSTTRQGTRKLNPCPICGRHAGKGGSSLWCEETTAGLILCMPGSTFSAEQKHGPLAVGQVVNDYALVKRSPIPEGDVLSFCIDKPLENATRHQRARCNLARAISGVSI